MPEAKNNGSKKSYYILIFLGLAPVYWFKILGKEFESLEVGASICSSAIYRSLAMVLSGQAAIYFFDIAQLVNSEGSDMFVLPVRYFRSDDWCHKVRDMSEKYEILEVSKYYLADSWSAEMYK